MAFYKSKYTGTEIDQRLTQGTYDDAVKAGFTGPKEEFDKIIVAFDENAQQKLDAAQPKIDHRLETLNKSIVDAINELHDEVNQKQDVDDYVDKEEFEGFKDEVAAIYATKNEVEESTDKINSDISTLNNNLVKSINSINENLNNSLVVINESTKQLSKTLVAEIDQRKDADDEINSKLANLESKNILPGAGISIIEESPNKIINLAEDTLAKIQYSDSEVRRLEKDKIPYAYDEKTQSNINVILPEGGSYLGNYGDENATVAKAAVYDGTKQLELGSSKVHTNINTDSNVTIETSTGKKTIATTDELVNVVNIPIRSLKDKVYTQSEILDWFGVTSVPELKQKISRGSQMYLRYGISLSSNPIYYKMPIEYTAFESANQIKLVFVGLNTRDDVASKYEMIMNLDETVIEGNSNVKLTITSIEPEDIDLSGYATKEELNDYAMKSELPDTSNFATKDEIPSLDGYVTETELNDKGYLTSVPEEYITESELTAKNYATKSEIPEFATVATSGDYNDLTNTPDLSVYQTKSDDSLTTSAKTISGAINEIKNSVDSISDPYEINLTNLLSAEDSESISTAIGGIDNLNATVQDNRIIVGTISNGSVSVSIRILGNVTTLYYLLDSVLGLTLNEIAITNVSGTLSKSVITHSVLTENMVINSLESDEATLPLSAAQGKILATDKQNKTDNNLSTTNKTIVGAINELLAKVQALETKNTELESRLAA